MQVPCRRILSVGAIPLAIILFTSSAALVAQVTTADILGRVTDPSGAGVPSAKVTATNLGTNATATAKTDDSGNYLVTLLPAGHYRVNIEENGFKSARVSDVTLAIIDRSRLDTTLQLGASQQTVEVTATTPALQSEESSVGSLINEHAVQDLLLNGRNFGWRFSSRNISALI
jgi:hypothetical protein